MQLEVLIMTLSGLQNKTKKIGAAVALFFAVVFLSSASAQAQYRDDRGYGRNGGYNRDGGYGRNGGYGSDIFRVAGDNGYQDGLRKGADDAREGHNNPTGTSEYKHATNGYDRRYGNKDDYKQAYRDGFLQGFDEAQRRYGNGRYGNRNRRSSNNGRNVLRQIILGY